MTLIVHLSDTHFGTEVPAVMRALTSALHALTPHIVTISGDITQRARPNQFHAAEEFMRMLPGEVKFAIPGNHDIPLFNLPARLLNPYLHYKHSFGAREGVWHHGDVTLIGYDATSRWRHTRGILPGAQLVARIAHARSEMKQNSILIASVHQPLAVALPEDQENVLIHAERTAQLFAENGVDIVLSGHVHMPLLITTQRDFPELPRSFVLSGAGTAISHRIRPGAPNSFNTIQVNGADSISLTRMDYDKTSESFGAVETRTFTRGAAGWQLAL